MIFCFKLPVSRDLELSHNMLYLLSPRLCFSMLLKCYSFVYNDDSLTSKSVIMRTKQQKCFYYLGNWQDIHGRENMFSRPGNGQEII